MRTHIQLLPLNHCNNLTHTHTHVYTHLHTTKDITKTIRFIARKPTISEAIPGRGVGVFGWSDRRRSSGRDVFITTRSHVPLQLQPNHRINFTAARLTVLLPV